MTASSCAKGRGTILSRTVVLFVVTAALALPLFGDQAATTARIVIGPNILVSRDGDVGHCETMIAANPKDPANLVGGSIVMIRPDGGSANKAYVSFDGGSTWADVAFPRELEHGGGDPQVGFGLTGTAYFVGLSDGMNFYRSEDGGRTWSAPILLGRGHDHEMLVTDHTFGPFAGRVYITDEADVPGSDELETLVMKRRVVLFRSADDGRSFVGPIEVARGDNTGLAAHNPLVLSDGALFIPMLSYPNYAVNKNADTWHMVFSLSSDGGVTFSAPSPIADIRFGGVRAMRSSQNSGRVDQVTGPVFAADWQGGRFRDRIYAAWTELDGDRFRLVASFSADRGATWSRPAPVDPAAPPDASEFQPMVAVNPDGVLGIFWYSTEGHPQRDRSDIYFTASVDGGQTFLPRRRVSSETSVPFGSGNLRPGPYVHEERGLVTAHFVSAMSRWPQGGDYIGMTAGSDGVFHPFWADGRSGTYQLYTAAVRVVEGVAQEAPTPAVPKQRASLSGKVTIAFDPISYDAGTREVLLPVRLQNTSQVPLYPPFEVELKELVHPYVAKSGEEVAVPEILNSANGTTGVGAIFDYSHALGDLDRLDPGAVTSAVVWRLRAASAVETDFYIGAEITGLVAKEASP